MAGNIRAAVAAFVTGDARAGAALLRVSDSMATGGLSARVILWMMCPNGRKIPALFDGKTMTYHKPSPPWIATVDLHDFDARVLAASHEHPVLVDFWADWCSPCLVIAPVLERVIAEFDGAVRLAKLEVDAGDNMKLAGHYRVRGFPTIILFSRGEEQDRFSGAHPAPYIRAFIERHLPTD